MMFGLWNAAQTCQRFVDEITRGLNFLYAYIDDFLITSDDGGQHHEYLKILFNGLNNYGVVINPTKCEFGVHEITFLRYSVNSDGIKPPPERVEAIIKLSKPADAKQLRRYLGMINFYRRFIPVAAKTLKPLNDLLKGVKKGNTPIEWSEQSENSFRVSQRVLVDATMLAHPIPGAPISLTVDASDYAMGAVLQQRANNELQPLGFATKSLTPAQQKYRSRTTRNIHRSQTLSTRFRRQKLRNIYRPQTSYLRVQTKIRKMFAAIISISRLHRTIQHRYTLHKGAR